MCYVHCAQNINIKQWTPTEESSQLCPSGTHSSSDQLWIQKTAAISYLSHFSHYSQQNNIFFQTFFMFSKNCKNLFDIVVFQSSIPVNKAKSRGPILTPSFKRTMMDMIQSWNRPSLECMWYKQPLLRENPKSGRYESDLIFYMFWSKHGRLEQLIWWFKVGGYTNKFALLL